MKEEDIKNVIEAFLETTSDEIDIVKFVMNLERQIGMVIPEEWYMDKEPEYNEPEMTELEATLFRYMQEDSESVIFADDELHGLIKQRVEEVRKLVESEQLPAISIYEQDGEKWVRVKVYQHDFLIAIHDTEKDGKTKFEWKEACEIAAERGYILPNREQFAILSAYKDEIYDKMTEAGGEEMKGCYWSVAQYNSNHAWVFYGNYGGLNHYYKCNTLGVRALAYVKS